MSISLKTRIVRTLKVFAIATVSLLAVVILIPELFPGYVTKELKKLSNQNINGEINFSRARLSIINHFPSLTLSLYNFSVKGSQPFSSDTLVAGKELAFGLDIPSIIHGRISITNIQLNGAVINIEADSTGAANYNIFTSADSSAVDTSSSKAQLNLKKITLSDSKLIYNDRSLPMMIEANHINYSGSGNLLNARLNLQSQFDCEDFNFSYDGVSYVENKSVHAKLITKINTHSLALKFEKNDLLINQLPVDFKGTFDFLQNGYAMDLRLASGNTTLKNIFTILPPGYLNWLNNTTLKGTASISASITGKYIASTKTSPELTVSMHVRDGFIQYKNAAEPISNLLLDFNARMPNLQTDSLYTNIDSLAFNIDSNYLKASWHSNGVDPLQINSQINSRIDLAKLVRASGISMADASGFAAINWKINGIYETGQNVNRRRPDTVITSIPAFDLYANISNGYFKYANLPEGIKDINLNLNANCKTSDYHNTSITVKNINAALKQSYIKGFFTIDNLNSYDLTSDIDALVNLAELKEAIPIKTIELTGSLQANLKGSGKYKPQQRIFPAVTSTIRLKNGAVKTAYYPNPITNIAFDAALSDRNGKLSGLKVIIKPLNLQFEGKPFFLQANLSNFNDLTYDIKANGSIDLESISKVFSKKGTSERGYIKADVALKGTQADAVAGKYEKLNNKGSIILKDIIVNNEDYPKPFYINSAFLTFENETIKIEKLLAAYANNHMELNGKVSNLINYTLQNGVLTGAFTLQANKINVQDFMVFAGTQPAEPSTGVVLLPTNIAVTLQAKAGLVDYNGLLIKQLTGKVLLDSGKLTLDSTAFRLADANVKMNASYASISPGKAFFSFGIKADSFDIQKAYREVKMFRDLASSAANAYGIVSLNYTLHGKLNDKMMPVYPSLTGGGIMQLENIKVNGLKLFSALGKASGKDSLSNPDLKKIAIKTTIAKNIINIERVKMKVMGFRPRFEGQTSFDGRLNLKGRIGLPPLGIIGLPFSVTGTTSNPVVKMRKNQQTLEGVKEDDDEKQD